MELYLGTGGYSNDDWLGLLYPANCKPADYLRHYAVHFNAVELNSSFYAIPGIKAFQGMINKSQSRMRFSIKAHQSITHSRDATPDTYQRLLESIQPLRDVGMLGPILLQFPYSFPRNPQNRLYLQQVISQLTDVTVAVEFRHASWDNAEVRDAFKKAAVTWVSVDYPVLSGLPQGGLHLTSSITYIRMHGRNTQTWWDGKSAAERHDYRYSSDELRPWVVDIVAHKAQLSQVYIMMQNTTKGHAIHNLGMLRDLFAEHAIEAPVHL